MDRENSSSPAGRGVSSVIMEIVIREEGREREKRDASQR